ncbi:MAG: aminoglycoside phosphotransferase family protein [Candidatus Zixiibacteriota bacterium]
MSKSTVSQRTARQNSADYQLMDAALKGLPAILDTHRVERALCEAYVGNGAVSVESAEIAYIRYKPATSCLAAYRATVRRGPSADEAANTVWFYVKAYHEDAFADAVSKATARDRHERTGHWRALPLPDVNSVLYPIESDTELKGLPTVFDARKVVRVIHAALREHPRDTWRISDRKLRLTVVRYKPEKRAVFRADTRLVNRESGDRRNLGIYIRVYSEAHDPRILELMRGLHRSVAASPDVRIAEPLLYDNDKRILMVREASGTPCSELLGQGDQGESLAQVARALAVFHRLDKVPADNRSAAEMLSIATATGRNLGRLVTELHDPIERIASRLQALFGDLPAAPQGLVHGDLHPGQILLGEPSEPVTLLDFDRTCRGDSVFDIGNFIAHLHLASLQEKKIDVQTTAAKFQAAYESASGRTIDPRLRQFWVATALLQLAISPFRVLRPNWRRECRAIVERCGELL